MDFDFARDRTILGTVFTHAVAGMLGELWAGWKTLAVVRVTTWASLIWAATP
jgi:hypothetical protein